MLLNVKVDYLDVSQYTLLYRTLSEFFMLISPNRIGFIKSPYLSIYVFIKSPYLYMCISACVYIYIYFLEGYTIMTTKMN